ncbi:MAG: hypothetical protein AB7O78_06720 [Thermoleophilia bacterium]
MPEFRRVVHAAHGTGVEAQMPVRLPLDAAVHEQRDGTHLGVPGRESGAAAA